MAKEISEFKVGSKVKVIAEGWCKDKSGKIESIARDTPKCYGVRMDDIEIRKVALTVWFRPEQIEREEKENE